MSKPFGNPAFASSARQQTAPPPHKRASGASDFALEGSAQPSQTKTPPRAGRSDKRASAASDFALERVRGAEPLRNPAFASSDPSVVALRVVTSYPQAFQACLVAFRSRR